MNRQKIIFNDALWLLKVNNINLRPSKGVTTLPFEPKNFFPLSQGSPSFSKTISILFQYHAKMKKKTKITFTLSLISICLKFYSWNTVQKTSAKPSWELKNKIWINKWLNLVFHTFSILDVNFGKIQYFSKVLKTDFQIQYILNTFNTAWEPCFQNALRNKTRASPNPAYTQGASPTHSGKWKCWQTFRQLIHFADKLGGHVSNRPTAQTSDLFLVFTSKVFGSFHGGVADDQAVHFALRP